MAQGASLPAAVVGNGSLLATFSACGSVERLFWPNVDWGQHLGELRVGIATGGRTRWLDAEGLGAEQRYLDDTTVLLTRLRGDRFEAEVLDFALPDEPVLVREVRSETPGELVVYCRPELDESARYGSVYVDESRGALVFWRRDRALALAVNAPRDAACARAGKGTDALRAAADEGRAAGGRIETGAVEGVLVGSLVGEARLVCAFGETPAEALERLDGPLGTTCAALLDRRAGHDARRLAEAADPLPGDGVVPLYRRSLLAFDLVSDRETGAVIAAPELDSDFAHSGGYGFAWGRDLAFITLAFLAARVTDLAVRALRYLVRVQSPEGMWLHRHWSDGSLAPSWGLHQVDETGAALFAFEAAWAELGDDALDRELWPATRRAADFLLGFLDPETGLPCPSVDLWEERQGEHAYSAAAVTAGLRAAAAMAGRHEPELVSRYRAAADGLAAAIDRELWSDSHGRYLRSRWVGRADADGSVLPAAFSPGLPYPNRTVASADPVDATVDVALLGLAWPFGAVDARSPRMRATVAAIEDALVLPDGGVLRYEGDVYAGGNPWILTTLWLGLWYRRVGDEAGYRRCVDYAVARQSETGLLPEQVTRDGQPAWVLPLTWSHAMLVLAARPELSLVAGS
jgi:GH15 family glucan-1,4-alpha-glucosidase